MVRIEAQCIRTNGRVTTLETWRTRIVTAVIVLAAVYGAPEAIGKIVVYFAKGGP